VEECPLSKDTERNTEMSFQAKITRRTPSLLSHAFNTPVVRELPSLSSASQAW